MFFYIIKVMDSCALMLSIPCSKRSYALFRSTALTACPSRTSTTGRWKMRKDR